MRITLIHPAIGHRRGERYIRSWQMEPLPAAAIAGLTPDDVEVRFYDDRMETIPYDEPTDAAVISLETYTARRSYQIASHYRERGVPVIVGGFHATLAPEEADRYAEAVVVGEAEGIWPEVIDDLRHGCLKKRYQGDERPDLADIRVDRRIFAGKRYLPIGLIETGRGCRFPCTFCAIQTFFQRSHRTRPPEAIIAELDTLASSKNIFFFVDDNFAGDIRSARELLRALEPLNRTRGLRWITQMSINAAHDEEFLASLHRAGCKGVLIGFESLDERNLKEMRKGFNTMRGGYKQALDNLRRHHIPVYATFVFGFDHDTEDSFQAALAFAQQERFYIAAFNHLTPFPGTPLYNDLQAQERLHYPAWWLDPAYRYNDVPFEPRGLSAQRITQLCVETRRRFYRFGSIARRAFAHSNRCDPFMFRQFLPVNLLHRGDVSRRNGYPLGDETWTGTLLEATK